MIVIDCNIISKLYFLILTDIYYWYIYILQVYITYKLHSMQIYDIIVYSSKHFLIVI